MRKSKGLVYDGPVQVLINLVEKPGIMCYSREQLLEKYSEEASQAANSNTGEELGPAGGARSSILNIIEEYGPLFAHRKRRRKKRKQAAGVTDTMDQGPVNVPAAQQGVPGDDLQPPAVRDAPVLQEDRQGTFR